MGQRTVRVNELVKREISDILHSDYRDESVYITISSVSIAPDLRNGRIYYSVIGGEDAIATARSLFRKIGRELQRKLLKRIILKYSPQLTFIYDPAFEASVEVQRLIDELDVEQQDE